MKNALIVAAGLTLAMPSFAEGPVDVAPRVKVVKATAVSSANVDSVTGSLFASKMLPIGFEVGGRLQFSKVQRGDEVKAGQLLGSLDTEIIENLFSTDLAYLQEFYRKINEEQGTPKHHVTCAKCAHEFDIDMATGALITEGSEGRPPG